jgi:eukaryotic-like serine/threonine-protein kinase
VSEPEVLVGRYQLDEVLGAGGMAVVYRGTDRILHRTVAVKVLAEPQARDPVFVERFRREARAAGGLNHPGIVAVYDTGSDGDRHFIVMEYVEGRTLAELLRDEGRPPPRQVAEIVEQVAGGLGYAHENGIVHRDVKPANIMVTPTGDAKIMDFGIARATAGEPLTQTAAVMGTATYIAPEQAEGKAVDARTDIYALGATMYQLLTGRPPFVGGTPVAVASMHVFEQPEPPTAIDPSVPAPLEAIALRALEKDPRARYQDAQEMRSDLEGFLGRAPRSGTSDAEATAAAVPVGAGAAMFADTSELEAVGEGSPRSSRRRAWLYAVGVVAVAALVALAVVLVAGAGNAGAPPQVGQTPPHRHDVHPSASPTHPGVVVDPPTTSPPAPPTPSPSPKASPTPRPSPSPSPLRSPSPLPSPSPSPSPDISPTPSPGALVED